MRHLLKIFLTISLVLVLIQPNDAGPLKKGLKLAKKYKKYAYLLASKKNRLYAIPFPMPLPVFVKRQHIYTQVPIIPRYVSRPQPYGTPALSAETASSYELMSGSHTTSAVRIPSSYATSTYSSSSPLSSSSSRKKPQDLASSGKYLSQIANLLGHTAPNLGSNKDLISKLLSGQAKVLPPSSLFSAIKTPSVLAGSHKHHSSSSDSEQQHQQQQSDQQDQDTKSGSSQSSSSAGGVTYDDAVSNSTKSDSSSSSSSETKTAASEMYRSPSMYRRSPYGAMYANPYAQFAPMMGPMVSPLVALSMASRASGMRGRVPMMRGLPQIASGDMMPIVDSYDGSNNIDQETQEMSASSPQDYESSTSSGRDNPAAYQNLLRQRQLQLQAQLAPERYLITMQKLQRQQLASRQQEILKLALLREQEVAAQLAESRQVLVRATQLGLPVDQASLLKYYSQQQQQ